MKINTKFSEDHASTYTGKRFIDSPHRIRLKECYEFIKENISYDKENIIDFGGESGFLGDFLAKNFKQFKSQRIYDLKHPLVKNVTTKFFDPDLQTTYLTFDMNKDSFDIKEVNNKSFIICSETLEHVGNPAKNSRQLINLARNSNCDLYISYPIETGFKGFIKFIIKLLIGRYKKRRDTKSLFNQFLWFIGLKKDFRGKKEMYFDHDGFNNIALTKNIRRICNENKINYKIFKGLFTIHIFIKKEDL